MTEEACIPSLFVFQPEDGIRARNVTGVQTCALPISAVRLLVKAGEFAGARRLGDSVLRAAPRGVAGPAGVAVLLGRPALAARLVAPEDPETEYPGSADNQSVTIPIAALRVGLELLAYASAGAP